MTKNKLLILVGVLLIIFIGVSVYVFAILVPNATQTATADLTPTPSATIVSTIATKSRRVTGMIQALGSQSLVITLNRGSKTLTINVDNATQYTSSTGSASFSDLKVGATVVVHGHTDPQDATALLATAIAIKG